MKKLVELDAALDAFKKELTEGKKRKYVTSCSAIGYEGARRILEGLPSAQQWIPCSERLPEEDHWLGGSGRQFSEKVMVTIVNHSDEDTWVDMTQTIDGKWACELPKYCKIVAWMPLPEPWKGEPHD